MTGSNPNPRASQPLQVLGSGASTVELAVLRILVAALCASMVAAAAFRNPIAIVPIAVVAIGAILLTICSQFMGVASGRGQGTQLSVVGLDRASTEAISNANRHATRIHHLADQALPGAVADQLNEMATVANAYVIALHAAATDIATPLSANDRRAVVTGLRQLRNSAERLAHTQQGATDLQPIQNLIDRADLMTHALQSPSP